MNIIFNLRSENTEWYRRINSTILDECPSYFIDNPTIGSSTWWKNYERNDVLKETKSGEIIFLGERTDNCDHILNIVEINCNGELIEFEVCDDWNVSFLAVGKILKIEDFTIEFMGKYGSYKFLFTNKVLIENT